MKISSPIRRIGVIFFINLFICIVLTELAAHVDIPGYNLALPIIFLLMMAFQQNIKTIQHALFIAVLVVFIPILSSLEPMQTAVIYSLFYLLTLLTLDTAKTLKESLPYPDILPALFIFIALLTHLPTIYIFGIVTAYLLSRITTFFLITARKFYENENQNNKKKDKDSK